MMTNISYYNKWRPPYIGQWQGSYFVYMTVCLELTTFMSDNFEHHSSQVAAEWGVCVVIVDVRHTVKNADLFTPQMHKCSLGSLNV